MGNKPTPLCCISFTKSRIRQNPFVEVWILVTSRKLLQKYSCKKIIDVEELMMLQILVVKYMLYDTQRNQNVSINVTSSPKRAVWVSGAHITISFIPNILIIQTPVRKHSCILNRPQPHDQDLQRLTRIQELHFDNKFKMQTGISKICSLGEKKIYNLLKQFLYAVVHFINFVFRIKLFASITNHEKNI